MYRPITKQHFQLLQPNSPALYSYVTDPVAPHVGPKWNKQAGCLKKTNKQKQKQQQQTAKTIARCLVFAGLRWSTSKTCQSGFVGSGLPAWPAKEVDKTPLKLACKPFLTTLEDQIKPGN